MTGFKQHFIQVGFVGVSLSRQHATGRRCHCVHRYVYDALSHIFTAFKSSYQSLRGFSTVDVRKFILKLSDIFYENTNFISARAYFSQYVSLLNRIM